MGGRRGKLIGAAPGAAFACELGLALGLTLSQVYALSAAEVSVWAAYREARGFAPDRLAGATALAGAYSGACWGGKAKPADLIPRFKQRETADDLAGVRAFFEAHGAPI